MSESESITPDWAGSHVLDILRHHVSPALFHLYSDPAACRLVCRSWRDVFSLAAVVITPKRFREHLRALTYMIKSTESIKLIGASTRCLDWLARIAHEGLQLVSLKLKFYQLTPEAASSVSKLLNIKIPHLRSLKLDFNDAPPQEYFRLIADAIADPPNTLNSIEISWPHNQDGGADALFVALSRNSTVRELFLGYSCLLRQSQDGLLHLLETNRTITHLAHGSSTYLGGGPHNFPDQLFRALETNTTLKVLNISSAQPSAASFASFRHNHTLEKLNLEFALLAAEAKPVIFSSLELNRGLKELKISFYSANYDAPSALGKFFATNSTLQTLRLKIGSPPELEYDPMFEGLASNTSLTCLDVDELSPKFCDKLAEFLEKHARNCPLRELVIQYSEIEMYGPRLVNALALLPRLESLDFTSAPTGPDSAAPLAELVEKSSSLKQLCLYKSSLGDAGLVLLCNAVVRNSTLRKLEIGGDEHDDSVSFAVLDVIKKCTWLQVLDFAGTEIPVKYRPMFEDAVTLSPLDLCFLTFADKDSDGGSNEESIELVTELQKRG
eukprot:TRINITY_DN3954_c0_g1_i1.p1 TRINITY_DN3954_c0_g1~~TRINITY_DN3954_c0_g1_i1.p1  ORF type:complete len:588 (-),score=77.80 TRINITY_DN3954_c0_g1_i1:796-2460(-)